MKPDLSDLSDEKYEEVVNKWEQYAGISTFELMEHYDTTECDSTERYGRETGKMNIIQFYHMDDAL